MEINKIYQGDSFEILQNIPTELVDCVITSPPYFGLRDYGVAGQIGLEESPEAYTQKLVDLFGEIKRVLKKEGTVWLNLGDSYATSHEQGNTDAKMGWKSGDAGGERQRHHGRANGGNLPSKNIIGIPWRVAFALQADGWYLRQDIIWAKPNPMPESVTDRCTKSHEYIFLLTKSPKYYFDNEAIREPNANPQRTNYTPGSRPNGENKDRNDNDWAERLRNKHKNLQEDGQEPNTIHLRRTEGLPDADYIGRNKRSVWTVNTHPYSEAHFATFPEKLIVPMVKAGCPPGG